MGNTKRTTIRLSDERQRLLEEAQRIVASGPNDDPPVADVIDAAPTHLIESQQRFDEARDELPPHNGEEVQHECSGPTLPNYYSKQVAVRLAKGTGDRR